MNRITDEFSKCDENVIFSRDFNTCINNNAMKSFFSLNDLTKEIN